jgi:hypothetical protein
VTDPRARYRMRQILVSAAALAVVAAIGTAPRAGGLTRTSNRRAAGTAGSITFGSPSVADPVHTYGEPDIKFSHARDGSIYVSGPWGTGTQRSIWNWSRDGGRTFVPMHAPPLVSAAGSDTQIPCPPGTVQCPGGGDTEISIDHTGKTYFSDLAALVTLKVATWDPFARVMETGLIVNDDQGLNGYDRQWFGMWDPGTRPANYTGPLPVNYLVYAEALLGCCQAGAYSLDGIDYIGPTVEYPIANDGPVVVDQRTGTVLEAVGVDSLEDVGVAILTRDPHTPDDPALKHAEVVKIADLPAHTTERSLFPAIALDRARNAYVTWLTRADGHGAAENPDYWQVWYSYASAATRWRTWSAPRKVSQAPSNTNVMPWITAGANGRIAIVWYGTSDTKNDPNVEDVHQPWFVYAAVITGANTAARPVIEQVQATRHPIHYGTICLEGLGCIAEQGNRNNADFFEVDTDPRDGAVTIAYNDTSNELVQSDLPPPPEGIVDHRGAPAVMVVRQNTGTGLFGTPVVSRPIFGSKISDRFGDSSFDPAYRGTAVPQLDIKHVTVRSVGDNLIIHIGVRSLSGISAAFANTGAGALDYVIRWIGPTKGNAANERSPVYYAAVEILPGEFPYAFAGTAHSIDLCSVSGCFPHVLDYGGPGNGGTPLAVPIQIEHASDHDGFFITVPRSLVGNPADGTLLESFSGFTFVRQKSAAIEITNAEAEAGIMPILIDGACCRDAQLGP